MCSVASTRERGYFISWFKYFAQTLTIKDIPEKQLKTENSQKRYQGEYSYLANFQSKEQK